MSSWRTQQQPRRPHHTGQGGNRLRTVVVWTATAAVTLSLAQVAVAVAASPGSAARPTVTGVTPRSAEPLPTSGTTTGVVTVSGTGFTRGVRVRFGHVRASGVTVTSPTRLTLTPPPHRSGTVDVTVHDAGGTSASTSADRFTYTGQPARLAAGTATVASSAAPYPQTITDLSCVSATFCALTGKDGTVNTYDGTSWSAAHRVETSTVAMTSVSCTSTTFCVAVAANGDATVYDGSTWSKPKKIDSHALQSVSCVTGSLCTAVDDSGRAVRGRAPSFGAPKVIASGRHLRAVSCASARFCVAVGDNGVGVEYRGTWGKAHDIGGHDSYTSVSCVSPTFCAASSTVYGVREFDGHEWSSRIRPDQNDQHPDVSCSSPTFCLVSSVNDSTGALYSLDGAVFARQADTPLARVPQVSCWATDRCLVSSSSGSSGGRARTFSYARDTAPPDTGPADPAPTTTHGALTLTGPARVHLTSSDATDENYISCATPTFCVAANGYAVTGSGQHFSASVPALIETTALSCASTTFCVAMSDNGYASYYNGTSWSAQTLVKPGAYVDDVSCTSRTFCVAVTAAGRALVYDGRRWAPSPTLSSSFGLDHVSCASSALCVVESDLAGTVRRYYRGHWGHAVHLASELFGVSCPSATFCAALTSSGLRLHRDPRSDSGWGAPVGKGVIRASETSSYAEVPFVSCTSASFCVAGTAPAGIGVYNGSTVTAQAFQDAPSTPGPDSVSCSTGHHCQFLGETGRDAEQYRIYGWSSS